MADLDEIYKVTIENNTNIKTMMKDHKKFETQLDIHDNKITSLENVGKKTIKEHLISFSKVCGAFLMIGGGVTFMAKVAEKLWL